MKNGNIADQLKMQERQISNERKNTDMQTGIYADKQANIPENKFENKQENLSNNNDNKQSSNTADLGLSSVFGLLTPDVSNKEEEQIPMKKKIKKKPKRGFRW